MKLSHPATCATSSFCFSWFSFSSASPQELQTQHVNPIRKVSAPATHVICWLSYLALMKRRTLPVGQGIPLSIIEKCLASFFSEIVKRSDLSLSAWQNSVTFRENATTVPVPCTSLLPASASIRQRGASRCTSNLWSSLRRSLITWKLSPFSWRHALSHFLWKKNATALVECWTCWSI